MYIPTTSDPPIARPHRSPYRRVRAAAAPRKRKLLAWGCVNHSAREPGDGTASASSGLCLMLHLRQLDSLLPSNVSITRLSAGRRGPFHKPFETIFPVRWENAAVGFSEHSPQATQQMKAEAQWPGPCTLRALLSYLSGILSFQPTGRR